MKAFLRIPQAYWDDAACVGGCCATSEGFFGDCAAAPGSGCCFGTTVIKILIHLLLGEPIDIFATFFADLPGCCEGMCMATGWPL